MKPITSRNDAIHVSDYFPYGAFSINITDVPGTSVKLPHDLKIFVSRNNSTSVPNPSMNRLFNVKWKGNLVVAKYSRIPSKGFVQYSDKEIAFTNVLIGM